MIILFQIVEHFFWQSHAKKLLLIEGILEMDCYNKQFSEIKSNRPCHGSRDKTDFHQIISHFRTFVQILVSIVKSKKKIENIVTVAESLYILVQCSEYYIYFYICTFIQFIRVRFLGTKKIIYRKNHPWIDLPWVRVILYYFFNHIKHVARITLMLFCFLKYLLGYKL